MLVMWILLSNVVISVLLDKFLVAARADKDDEEQGEPERVEPAQGQQAPMVGRATQVEGSATFMEPATRPSVERAEHGRRAWSRHVEMLRQVHNGAAMLQAIMRELERRGKLEAGALQTLEAALGSNARGQRSSDVRWKLAAGVGAEEHTASEVEKRGTSR